MKIDIVVVSINELETMKLEAIDGGDHDLRFVIVDEGDVKVRRRNSKILESHSFVHYGPRERTRWFRSRFGRSYKKFLSVIPERAHAETSFGFLVAFEEEPDLVLELDDDTVPSSRLVERHAKALFDEDGVRVDSKCKWYNTIENMKLNFDKTIFPRGHPYEPEARSMDYKWETNSGKCVLNMGLWIGDLDLDALTILYNGGMNGKCSIAGKKCKRDRVIIQPGVYFAICSMNVAFIPKVIPAFYQLYMNYLGVDRFDDIWSGLFLKKIADNLGDNICLGEPTVIHNKRPRNTMQDLRKELDGMIVNEKLWTVVDQIDIAGDSYFDAYRSLADSLKRFVPVTFQDPLHKKFMLTQIEKMKLWLKIIDKLD